MQYDHKSQQFYNKTAKLTLFQSQLPILHFPSPNPSFPLFYLPTVSLWLTLSPLPAKLHYSLNLPSAFAHNFSHFFCCLYSRLEEHLPHPHTYTHSWHVQLLKKVWSHIKCYHIYRKSFPPDIFTLNLFS